MPVRVRGWKRAWNFVLRRAGMCALGVSRARAAVSNGVLVHVSLEELPKFDAREGGYKRRRLDPKVCTPLGGDRIPADDLWIYVPTKRGMPTNEAPIVQSYVDVVLQGCLTISSAFADEFVQTTDLWDTARLDDRKAPRYARPLKAGAPLKGIDAVLRRNGRTIVTPDLRTAGARAARPRRSARPGR